MKTIIKSEDELDIRIKNMPMLGNIYYIVCGVDDVYSPIDWSTEYITITTTGNRTSFERINY